MTQGHVRRGNLRRVDLPVLTVQGVARLLHCSVDRVRRIPSSDLPYTRVGRRNLYLLDDVLEFVRRQGRSPLTGTGPTSPNSREVIDQNADSVRGRSQRRRTP